MSTIPPSMPSQQPMGGGAPAPKKTSPLVWILAGIGGFLVLCFIGCGLIGFYALHKVKQMGFDPDLMKKNPGLAMTKMAASLHPDMDVVSTNDSAGTITMRDRKTGKEATFKVDSDKGTLVIQTDEGTVKFGANTGAQMPSWVPTYPGSTVDGTFSISGDKGSQGTFTFKSSDSAEKVISFYQDQLKSAGMNITMTSVGGAGGTVSAENADKSRTVLVVVSDSSGSTTGSITVAEKK